MARNHMQELTAKVTDDVRAALDEADATIDPGIIAGVLEDLVGDADYDTHGKMAEFALADEYTMANVVDWTHVRVCRARIEDTGALLDDLIYAALFVDEGGEAVDLIRDAIAKPAA